MADNLPSWVHNAINALGGIASGADSTAHLGYNTAVQGIGNALGYPQVSLTESLKHPFNRQGTPPSLARDLGGEQYRDQVRSAQFNPLASTYLGQVPVGAVWTDLAPLKGRQWDSTVNPQVTNGKEWQAGTKRNSIIPFSSVETPRESPDSNLDHSYYIPEQWAQNNESPEQAGGLDLVPGTGIWTTPPRHDATNESLPLNERDQRNLRHQLYYLATEASGGINLNNFNQDLGAYIQQNPQILQDIQFVNGPFYNGMDDERKLKQIHAQLGAIYGVGLKNTPLAPYYNKILK